MVGNLITSTMIAVLQVQPIQMGHKVYGLLHAMLGALTLHVLTGLYRKAEGWQQLPELLERIHTMKNHKTIWCQKIQTTQTLKPPSLPQELRHAPDQEHELRHSREIICLFLYRMFYWVSLEFPRREGRCSQGWNYASFSICHESFGSITRRVFLSLPESVLVFLCGTAWLHLADFIICKKESRMPNQVPNITQNH